MFASRLIIKHKIMDKEILTPEDSIALITKTIQQAKNRFAENGHILIMWGILVAAATLAQFLLLKTEYYKINYYPYFIMPLGGVYTYYYYGRKHKKNDLPVTIIGRILQIMGTLLGINFMVLGFLFWEKLGDALFPVLFLFMAVLIIIIGTSIKFKPFIFSGILLNLTAFGLFFIETIYHPAIMSVAAIITMVIPGIILYQSKAKYPKA